MSMEVSSPATGVLDRRLPANPCGAAGGLTINAVSLLLGVPAPTLRSWERRYGIPPVAKNNAGHRRYSTDDVAMLTHLRGYIADGHRPLEAAALVQAWRRTSPTALVEAYLDAAANVDDGGLRQALETAEQFLGLERTVDELVFPALRELGERWTSGRGDVAGEHLASEVTRHWLAGGTAQKPVEQDHQTVVLACGPADQHTIGLEALATVLTRRRLHCLMLGARTPAESLSRAVRSVSPVAVVVVSHLSTARRAAVEALDAVSQLPTLVFFAGGVFGSRQSRQGVQGQYLGDHLGEAAASIADAIKVSSR